MYKIYYSFYIISKIYLREVIQNWERKCYGIGIPVGETNIILKSTATCRWSGVGDRG